MNGLLNKMAASIKKKLGKWHESIWSKYYNPLST